MGNAELGMRNLEFGMGNAESKRRCLRFPTPHSQFPICLALNSPFPTPNSPFA